MPETNEGPKVFAWNQRRVEIAPLGYSSDLTLDDLARFVAQARKEGMPGDLPVNVVPGQAHSKDYHGQWYGLRKIVALASEAEIERAAQRALEEERNG